MSTDKWKSWCRLCAREDGSEQNRKQTKILSDILQKYFHISVSIANDCLLVACQDCIDLIMSAGKFALRCARVSYMFWELSNGKYSKTRDNLVRKMYDLSESEESGSVNLVKVEEADSKIKYLEIEYIEDQRVDSDVDCTDSVQHEEIEANSICEDDTIDMLDDQTEIKSPKRKRAKNKPKSTEGFTCTMCGMKFSGPKWYERHIETCCADLTCSKCPKRFTKRYNLKEHERTHLPKDVKTLIHKCSDCQKTYRTAANLRGHTRLVHTKERLCVCEECGKEFIDLSSLRIHKVVHVQERLSQCTLCPKAFKNLSHLKKHMDIHSDNVYECDACGKKFNRKRCLTSHLTVHFAEKIYKCHLCKFAFKRRYGLKKHLIVHSGIRPWPCSYCDKAFTDVSRKRYHERIYHPKEYALQTAELLINTE